MRCIQDNQWKPALAAHFVDFLYEKCRDFIDADFQVPVNRVIRGWTAYLTPKTTRPGPSIQPFHDHVLNYVINKLRDPEIHTSHEDIQKAFDYCENRGATFVGNTLILTIYLN